MHLRRVDGRPARAVRRAGAAAVALMCGGLLVACGGGPTDPGLGEPTTTEHPPTRTEEYRPGLSASVWEQTEPGRGPLVVLIPGGGWVAADPGALAPLASALVEAGLTVVTATYRTSSSGTFFPEPLEDVLCAVAYAAAIATPSGDASHPVVVVGHSAGANLVALAALTPEASAPSCPYPPVAPDALVGLAGPYDVAELPDLGVALFGTSAEDLAGRWAEGNPVLQAGLRADVPVLLLHGEDDEVVPVAFTTTFGAALEDGGHDVTVDVVPGADHSGILHVDVAAARLVDWIGALP